MSLLQKIKQDQLVARKERDGFVGGLLTVLYSEASIIGFNDGKRESTDEEVVKVIKKFIKGIDENISVARTDDAKHEFLKEKAVLEKYLPKQLTEEQLTNIIGNYIRELGPNKSAIMKNLKETLSGQYDGKMAAIIFDQLS